MCSWFYSYNSRWPFMVGNRFETTVQHDSISSTTTSPNRKTEKPISASAFKAVTAHPKPSSPQTSQSPPNLPPTPYTKERTMNVLGPTVMPPLPGLCPPYLTQASVAAAAEERAHAALINLKDNPSIRHPAFPLPMPFWGLHSHQPYHPLPPLHHMFNVDKAMFNSAPSYLNDTLSMASAKPPFFDLSRMGHYPLGKKLFGCPQCRYITDRKNNLKRHIATMHQECDKVLECCGVVFKNKASLRDHVLIFHSNGYMCRFCGRNFCRKALLKRHLTVHSGQKDYICTLCDYATSHKSNLERHKKVHERQGTDDEQDDEDDQMIPESPPVSPRLLLHGALAEGAAMSARFSEHFSERSTLRTHPSAASLADVCREDLRLSTSISEDTEDDDQNSLIDVEHLNT